MGISACLALIAYRKHVNIPSRSISIRSRHEASEAWQAKSYLQQNAIRSLQQHHASWLLQHVFRRKPPSTTPPPSHRAHRALRSVPLSALRSCLRICTSVTQHYSADARLHTDMRLGSRELAHLSCSPAGCLLDVQSPAGNAGSYRSRESLTRDLLLCRATSSRHTWREW